MNKITVKEKYYHFTKDGKKKTKCVLELENMDKFEATLFGMNIIENNAFSNCNGLKKLKFNEGLSIIGPNSFFKCSNIISIYLPPTLTSINYNAFNYCGLTGDLKIPSSVKNIDENAFHENKNLNGKLFLSEGLLEIGRNCFENCSFTGELKIPETVEYIGKEAFSGCNFSKIYVPKNNVNKWVIGWNNGLNCEIIEY